LNNKAMNFQKFIRIGRFDLIFSKFLISFKIDFSFKSAVDKEFCPGSGRVGKSNPNLNY